MRDPRARWATATHVPAPRTTAASSSTRATTARRRSSFRANPHGIQYDAVIDDATGNEDSSPDFFWDVGGARSPRQAGRLEIRIPFASLRYPRADPADLARSCSTGTTRATSATSSSAHAPAARRQLLHLPRRARSPGSTRLPSRRRARRGRALRDRQPAPTRHAGRRCGAPLEDASLEGDGRPGREVDAQRRHGAVDAHGQPRLLADRVGRGADLGATSASRSSIPRSGRSSWRASSSSRRPSRRVYTRTDHRHPLGPARHGQVRRHRATPRSVARRTEAAARSILPGPSGRPAPTRTSARMSASARLRRDFGTLVRERPRHRRARSTAARTTASFGPDFQWRPAEPATTSPARSSAATAQTPAPARPGRRMGRAAPVPGTAPTCWWSHLVEDVSTGSSQYKDIADDFRADVGLRAPGRIPRRPTPRRATRSGRTGLRAAVADLYLASATAPPTATGDLLNRQVSARVRAWTRSGTRSLRLRVRRRPRAQRAT